MIIIAHREYRCPQQSPMRRDQDGNRVKILRPRALSTEVQSESESDDSDDSDDNSPDISRKTRKRIEAGHSESENDDSDDGSDGSAEENKINSSEDEEGYGLVRTRSNSVSQAHPIDPASSSAGAWGDVKPSEPEHSPEDEEIAYLEKKLFSGKYKGSKGRKKLEREWVEKDGFDAEFASFINELGSATSKGESGAHHDLIMDDDVSDSSDGDISAMRGSRNGVNGRQDRMGSSDGSVDIDGDSNVSDSEDEPKKSADDKDKVINLYSAKGGAKPSAAEIYGQTPMLGDNEGSVKIKKYVPPHLRRSDSHSLSSASASGGSNGNHPEDGGRLQRQVNGLFNRCGESNIESIANALAGLYSENPNALVNRALSKAILDACCGIGPL